MDSLTQYFSEFSTLAPFASTLTVSIFLIGLIILAIVSNLISKRVILALISRLLNTTTSTRDDILVKRGVFHRLSQLVPALIIFGLAPVILINFPVASALIVKISLLYMIFIGVMFIDALISAGLEIYSTYPVSREVPITSFAQVAKLLLYFLGAISILSIILGQSPMALVAGLGAIAAVLMFVFKDPILGLVAGIQLSANRMVAVGDWIEMPKFSVDGDIIEIALTTVKIRNFDKTITTIPTQALINDSFKNWRGMQETGGRRIKRSINLDMATIQFCDEEMLERFSRFDLLKEYIAEKRADIAANNGNAPNLEFINQRNLTNIGTFRAYVISYLQNHPKTSKNLTLLVRQLQPTENGLPLEIYVFSNETNWKIYESIQADIFDHILAVLPEFGLRVFQNPTGSDFQNIAQHPQ